jgi:hypothetical protein
MLSSEIIAVNHQPSNERLQRTRYAPLRSPLSRQPFGDGTNILASASVEDVCATGDES